MKKAINYKVGKVALVGRPNTGKSTLLNNIIGQKVAIVSPMPQTTQCRITAVFESDQGQIFFRDTPGFFNSKLSLNKSQSIIKDTIKDTDLIIYVVDRSKNWGREEEEIFNIVKFSHKPFILVFNKIDIESPNYQQQYLYKISKLAIMILETSAYKNKGLKALIANIFDLIPEGTRDTNVDDHVSPLLSQNSQEYLEEIIREKIFLLTKQEIPYRTQTHVTSVINNEARNLLKVRGKIKVDEDKYKSMIIGKDGGMIRKISDAVKEELINLTGKKIYIELKVI